MAESDRAVASRLPLRRYEKFVRRSAFIVDRAGNVEPGRVELDEAFVRIGPHTPVPVLDEALSAQMTPGDQRAVLRTP